MTNKKPNPGSDKAIEQGCICAVSDNAGGDERLGRTRGFYIEKNCPLHEKPEQIGELTKDTEDCGEKMTNNKPYKIINSAVGKYIELHADSEYRLGDPAMYPKVTELFDEKIKEIEDYAQEYAAMIIGRELTDGDGWDHHFSDEAKCCPGDDFAYYGNRIKKMQRKLNKEKGGRI